MTSFILTVEYEDCKKPDLYEIRAENINLAHAKALEVVQKNYQTLDIQVSHIQIDSIH